jgi:hypothetical protein
MIKVANIKNYIYFVRNIRTRETLFHLNRRVSVKDAAWKRFSGFCTSHVWKYKVNPNHDVTLREYVDILDEQDQTTFLTLFKEVSLIDQRH